MILNKSKTIKFMERNCLFIKQSYGDVFFAI